MTSRVIQASEADGAKESGLKHLIWNQVLSYGTDAMVTVALAGTVFFGASTDAKRGNVLLYLLVTMAPFAVVAPIIGPALDRLQHGRRWAMGGTALGRGILALFMAEHSDSLLWLYPCALGSLVLSKAYSVIRASAAPRLVPEGMTLVEANARLSIFGMAAATVGGAFVGAVIKLTGSYTTGLVVTALAFFVCGYFAFTLPSQIDSASPAKLHPDESPRPLAQDRVPPIRRIIDWAGRGMEAKVIVSLQGEASLRFLSGLLTIYFAFYIESAYHGWEAVGALGGIAVAAGAGNFIGTGIGTRLKLRQPQIVILIAITGASVGSLLCALFFGLPAAVVGMFGSGIANSLSKIALDAEVQQEVPETFRSSVFARTETFLQLAWVLGATIGVVLPATDGSAGFWVSSGALGAIAIVSWLRWRALGRLARRGNVNADHPVPTEPQHWPGPHIHPGEGS